VTFGHMHHNLRHREDRLRTIINTNDEGTVYLNAASVPRIKKVNDQRIRNFSLVEMQNSLVTNISLVWVDDEFKTFSKEVLYQNIN
jgi:uncharacterized protein (TIGR04168 family)